MKNYNSLLGVVCSCYQFTNLSILSCLSIFLFNLSIQSQNKPFPQQNDWANCIKPNKSQTELNSDVASFYEIWKTQYLRETDMPGGYYVHGECTGCTEPAKGTSESHGWGMLITVLMAGYDTDAKTYFDGFYNYFDQHRSPFNDELMSWMVEYSENGGEATATDGDLDIAYALLLAHDQWGSDGTINYLEEAKDMITLGIKVSDMNVNTQRVMLGTWDTNQYSTRSSDWMLAQFRAFETATGDSFWNGAIDTAYGIMNTIQTNYSSNTGLMPDFIVGSSAQPADPYFLESENDGAYNWNACRFPWRVAMDYAHYGNADAKTVVDKVVNWAKGATSNNPANYKAGYTLAGSPLVEYSSTAFTSPLLVASIVDASHQDFLDSGWDFIKGNYYSYYDASINMLSMLVISGNWWAPELGETSTTTDNLTVSSLYDFNSDGGSQTIIVVSNIDWTVNENSNWITVNSINGSGNGAVGVIVSENTSTDSRSADITISGGDITRSITVFQAGAEGGNNTQTAYKDHSIPGVIEFEDYDNGGQGVAYNDTTTINSGGASRTSDGVDIQNSSDAEAGFNVGWTVDGEWLEYTIGAVASGVYDINLRIASNSTNSKSISLSLDGDELGSASIAYTGGWQTWETLTLSNVEVSGGDNQVLRVSISGGNYNINYVDFQIQDDNNNSANCDNLPTWSSSTTYGEAGTQVVYNNIIYENKWYTLNQNPENHSANSWDLWTIIGSCDSAAKSLDQIAINGFEVTSYPNPFTNVINVVMDNTNLKISSLQLLDLSGKVIVAQEGTSLNNVEAMASGVYLLKVLNTTNQVISFKKVIKK